MPVGASQSTVADDGRKRAGHLKAYVTRGIYTKRTISRNWFSEMQGSQKKVHYRWFRTGDSENTDEKTRKLPEVARKPPGFLLREQSSYVP